MKPKKDYVFRARIDASLRKRLDAIYGKNWSSDALVGRGLVEAFCNAVERCGKISAPYTIIGAQEAAEKSSDQLLQLVAEQQAAYGEAMGSGITDAISNALKQPKGATSPGVGKRRPTPPKASPTGGG